MEHPIRCKCGAVQGAVNHPERAHRGVCYCRDCQTYAHALGFPGILDALGGTDVVATLPRYVAFTTGTDKLACLSLTEHGLLRWYASCCRTPIGNTLRNYKVSYVGLVHNCLEGSGKTLDSSFGPVRMAVNSRHAKSKVSPMFWGTLGAVVGLCIGLVRARLGGNYKKTPFFGADGVPLVSPRVLSIDERERARRGALDG